MMQRLLEERFKLKIHRATTEIPVYMLVVAGKGARLQPFEGGTCTPRDFTRFLIQAAPDLCRVYFGRNGSNATLVAQGVSLADLSVLLSSIMDRPVIDNTQITGRFELSLEYASDISSPEEPSMGPSIFTALKDHAGLKLVPSRGSSEMLIIDSVERPSEN